MIADPAQNPERFADFIAAAQKWLEAPRRPLWPGAHLPDAVIYPLFITLACLAILGVVSVAVMILVYAERKIAGHIQHRFGPNRVGWRGILQSVADGIKLFAKEDVIPDPSLRFLFSFAPVLILVGAITPFAALPFAPDLVVANMDIGLFYILAFASLEVIGVLTAGWASGSKWSLYGGMRVAAQMMSYEIPLSLSVLVVVVLAGSLNLTAIAGQQHLLPYVIQSPFAFVGFFLFYIAGLASTKRAPFDLPEAESELVSGFHTEYSGMRFAFIFLAEYASMVVICAVASIVFLGGWNFPLSGDRWPWVGVLQLSAKTIFLLFLMIWLRWTLPRVRIDQVMYLCLKVLLPFGLVCVLGAGVQVVAGVRSPLASSLGSWFVFALVASGMWALGRRADRQALEA